jgi:hypothetical protein
MSGLEAGFDPTLPRVRGPITSILFASLTGKPTDLSRAPIPTVDDPLEDDDFQLALYCCYELHYRGFAGVDADREWDPDLLAFRRRLELDFERALTELAPRRRDLLRNAVRPAIEREIAEADGPSLSRFLLDRGDRAQFREFVIHRSAYQRKEADPHSWAIPRYDGPSRAALVEIQADEYGNGQPGAAHADLFAMTMQALDLDPTYGAYLDVLPGITLATTNLISLLGLHRRLLPALLGHLAVFEMTSVVPMRRYAEVVDRHGLGEEARRFYDVHVAADAHHGPLAANTLVGEYVAARPDHSVDVLWGAQILMAVEERFARHLLEAWSRGCSSLRLAPALQRAG